MYKKQYRKDINFDSITIICILRIPIIFSLTAYIAQAYKRYIFGNPKIIHGLAR